MRTRKNKDPFAELDPDFKNAVESMSEVELRHKIAEVAMNEADNKRLEKEDQDLAEKKELVKSAAEQYRSATKANVLRIGYCKSILEARGKRLPLTAKDDNSDN